MKKTKGWLITIIAIIILVFVISTVPSDSNNKTINSNFQDTKDSNLTKNIHNLINKERSKAGLSKLNWDGALAKMAQDHTEDMVNKNYFSHTSPNGCDLTCRFKNNNYVCNGMYAENIAQNTLFKYVTYTSEGPEYNFKTQEEIAQDIVASWMGSSGHRNNILTSSLKSEGIGIIITEDKRVFVTQAFC